MRSIGRDTKFTAAFFHFFMYGNGFLSRGFIDWRKILKGSSATSQTGLIPFGGDNPMDGRVFDVNRGHMAGYAFFMLTDSSPSKYGIVATFAVQ